MDNEPATKQDIQQLRSEFQHGLGEVRSEFQHGLGQVRSEFQHGFDDLKETIRDSQTEMLKAFYNFSESNNKRLTQSEGNELADRSRIETLERRVTDLEKRLNIDPAA
jgi:hypothetical protein